jgi:hypothetical protein
MPNAVSRQSGDAEMAAPGWWCEGRAATDASQRRAAVLLWHFNCRIAGFAHPSWIEHPALISHPGCSAHLLARHGLAGCHDWHCDAAAKRLWLLDSASLAALALALGGVAQAPLLRRSVRRDRRQALQDAWPRLAWDAAHDPLAPLLNVALPASAANAASTAAEAADSLARLGAQILRGLLAPGWRAVAGRARLRLPKAWADDEPRELPATEQHALLSWITAVWVPQRSAAWAWLF